MLGAEVWDGGAGTGFGEVGRFKQRWMGLWSVTEPGRAFWST